MSNTPGSVLYRQSTTQQSMHEFQNKYGVTYRPPEWDKLLIACQKNNAQLVALLLTPKELGGEGISANHANAVDQSALHVACLWAHVDCVAILLKYGANVHARNKITSATPLHATCQSNRALKTGRRVQVVDLLVKAGANLDSRDQNDKLALDYVQDSDPDADQLRAMLSSTANLPASAFYYQLPQIEHSLIEGIKKKCTIDELELKLTELASVIDSRTNEEQDIQILPSKQSPMKELLERWMQCEDLDMFSLQALEAFIKHEYTCAGKAYKLYLEPKGPIDELVGQLCKAIVDRYKSIGKHLRDALLQEWIQGVALLRPCVMDTSSASALWLEMSRRNYLELANVWWETFRLDPTPIVGPQEMTPIHFAARSGNLEFTKLLVKIQTSKPDPKSIGYILAQKTNLGQTPLEAAKVNGKQDIVEWFESLQASS
ncbi:unnamed protein product [Cylindrotheca closterium]|uniref:Ankyrin repeat protein n=1 Tax=Cylindrotheca closterium TaxID=2856 RepID=A0AAD2G052_9STRA|nr:unnamed protein product [Cylindrotheca closterium]